ncbi:hypothetical protein [Nitrosomonas sp. Nm34]|uniref:hypothetical protein n=1 Tax=Nitrosomonas sp. Nm34 TaxID=1881055 RepID=UPI0008F25835|nr:hypothetical protein [Nitrosomonas sp. Nm34]SFI39138.1 hypothetical protein SAMN05428978_100825 [Nitrosomonas sp. Nm34]
MVNQSATKFETVRDYPPFPYSHIEYVIYLRTHRLIQIHAVKHYDALAVLELEIE